MARIITRVLGARGRTLSVYDTKCVINTSVTAGSILSGNATDGEKTIFYLDCVGVQYKDAGKTLGYLQLETPSMQMNNQTSNFFSENTFSFENVPGSSNPTMQEVYAVITDLVEQHKYYAPVGREEILAAALRLAKTGLVVEAHLLEEAREFGRQTREQEERALKQKRQQVREEAQQRLEESQKHMETLRDSSGKLHRFLAEARGCKRVMDVMALWRSYSWEELSEEKKAQL